jgi:hypothetical protein
MDIQGHTLAHLANRSSRKVSLRTAAFIVVCGSIVQARELLGLYPGKVIPCKRWLGRSSFNAMDTIAHLFIIRCQPVQGFLPQCMRLRSEISHVPNRCHAKALGFNRDGF